ncbi:hypothetical protein JYU34_006407 [Plutella xylostella]|uniref:Uncharacterized protein n=1 Tax=Plutella xylostella TaxID=51655 RepID=A0ABQ7QRW7_PLUXY|nr:hypothetical protein JYU34_006407 [Plutella xylostella]
MAARIIMCTMVLSLVALVVSSPAAGRGSVAERPSGQPEFSSANLSYDELVFILKNRNSKTGMKPPKTFSPCARAILSCCTDKKLKTKCSEDMGCGAHFFDDNPCDEKFVVEALRAAKIFYRQFFKR